MTTAILVVMTGLPGTGKSAIADAVADHIGSPVFSVDPLEATLNRAGITRSAGSDRVAYDLVATLVERELGAGRSAVIDAVNGRQFLRDWWRRIAARHHAKALVVATCCSDSDLHRRRIETRVRDLDGFRYELTWRDVRRACRSTNRPPTRPSDSMPSIRSTGTSGSPSTSSTGSVADAPSSLASDRPPLAERWPRTHHRNAHARAPLGAPAPRDCRPE